MEIHTHTAKKTVAVWLRHGEGEQLKQSLEAFYQHCHTHGYQVAVFLSGKRPLTQCTSDLLCYNRKRLAELGTALEQMTG